jgi:hypothetical protein
MCERTVVFTGRLSINHWLSTRNSHQLAVSSENISEKIELHLWKRRYLSESGLAIK